MFLLSLDLLSHSQKERKKEQKKLSFFLLQNFAGLGGGSSPSLASTQAGVSLELIHNPSPLVLCLKSGARGVLFERRLSQ